MTHAYIIHAVTIYINTYVPNQMRQSSVPLEYYVHVHHTP